MARLAKRYILLHQDNQKRNSPEFLKSRILKRYQQVDRKHFLWVRVSIAENNGSIFHFDSIIFFAGGGGGGIAIIIIFCGSLSMRVAIAENNGSIFHFNSIILFAGEGGAPLLLFSVGPSV